MKVKDSSRQAHFPAILKKHGKSMKYWLAIVKKLEAEKYPVQISHLKISMASLKLMQMHW